MTAPRWPTSVTSLGPSSRSGKTRRCQRDGYFPAIVDYHYRSPTFGGDAGHRYWAHAVILSGCTWSVTGTINITNNGTLTLGGSGTIGAVNVTNKGTLTHSSGTVNGGAFVNNAGHTWNQSGTANFGGSSVHELRHLHLDRRHAVRRIARVHQPRHGDDGGHGLVQGHHAQSGRYDHRHDHNRAVHDVQDRRRTKAGAVFDVSQPYGQRRMAFQ